MKKFLFLFISLFITFGWINAENMQSSEQKSKNYSLNLYNFEFKVLPKIIGICKTSMSFQSTREEVFDYLSDKDNIIEFLNKLNLSPTFDINDFTVGLSEKLTNGGIIVYTFPTPNETPLAKYGGVVIQNNEVNFYTLEFSQNVGFNENGIPELKTEWFLGEPTETGHKNFGLVKDCPTPRSFIEILKEKGIISK